MINSYKILFYPKKRATKIYISKMKDIERNKGYFTTQDLVKITPRDIGTCQNIICKFRKKGLVKCIEPYCAGNLHNYAKYQVVK